MDSTNANGARILVIDDNPIIQRTMYFTLRDLGHRPVLCGDISSALKVIREQPLNLILLDLNFPFDAAAVASSMQDGFGILGWVRHRNETQCVPVIIISSDPPEKSKARALAAGAAAYLPKPVDKQLLTTTVASLLSPGIDHPATVSTANHSTVDVANPPTLRMRPVNDSTLA